tara:strand:+ start:4837 stop:5214 length:378 start_codon:yes stop_codon:yes gene_type:complete
MIEKQESSKLGLLTLLASTSTLICCALPALFVTLGAGATFASMANAFPQLIIISHYKVYISVFTLIILIIAGILIEKSKHDPCPVDPSLRDICLRTRKRTFYIYYISVGIFVFASFFTYVFPEYL